MTDADRIRTLDCMLAAAHKVAVVVHQHPDGDAMGSGTAMVLYLMRCRGLDAALLVPDAPPETLSFISTSCPYTDAAVRPLDAKEIMSASDLVICLDHNDFSRTASIEPLLRASAARKVLIDHHLSPSLDDFDLAFSCTEVSSASELLYWVLKDLAGGTSRLPSEVLTPLMTGMTTDSNNFANSVYPSTLEMASELLAAGVDRDDILLHLYGEYRENRFRAMGCYLSELMHITPYGVAYAVLDSATAARLGVKDGETEGFVNLPLGIDGVKMSIFLKEDDGFFRVSIRSRLGVSACRLAGEAFHGGGHEYASGGRLFFPGDISDPSRAPEFIEEVTARFMCNGPVDL